MANPSPTPPTRPPITLAVLAGGAGSRMGVAKSGLTLAGCPVLSRLLDRLQWDGPTLLVTAPSNTHPAGAERFDLEVSDPEEGGGPALGLLTALNASTTEQLVLIPVDMPLLTSDCLRLLGERHEQGILCRRFLDGEELIEPFPGMFRKSMTQLLIDYLARGRRSLHGLLTLPDCTIIDATDWTTEIWTNLNTPQDLDRYERDYASS